MSDRTDAFGRAYAGSQRQIQTYLNRRRADLDAAILRGLPELAAEGAQFRVGLTAGGGTLQRVPGWPQGGPAWDAVGWARCSWAYLSRTLNRGGRQLPHQRHAP
jgi:hypothetical protein